MLPRPPHRCAAALALLASALAFGPAGAGPLQQGATRLGSYGPVEADEGPPPLAVAPRPLARAPEHQSFMSPLCASLRDGLRTAPARGTGASTLADLYAEYAQRCRDDEAQALARWQQDRSRSAERRQQQRADQQADMARTEQAQQQQAVQCSEIRRILARRHERLASLTPGELNDLRRFEAIAAERCPTVRP